MSTTATVGCLSSSLLRRAKIKNRLKPKISVRVIYNYSLLQIEGSDRDVHNTDCPAEILDTL